MSAHTGSSEEGEWTQMTYGLVLGLRIEEVEDRDEDKVANDENQEVFPRYVLESQGSDLDQQDDDDIECCISRCNTHAPYTSRHNL